jgi:uncharacterized membrane protein YidH (DUF202 family)
MELLTKIEKLIINPIIGLLIAIGVIVFLWGVIEFIAGADSEEKRKTGKNHILWGVVGLFIAVSAFGIMNLLANFWK